MLLFFASFIIFGFWLTYELKKHRDLSENAELSFWEKEAKANSIRKKSLDDLTCVHFDFNLLPSDESFGAEPVPESLSILRSMKDKKLANLSGISNTDLKLTYGTANITLLSEYDNGYITFEKNICDLAQVLYDLHRMEEAQLILEKTLLYQPDVRSHYRILALIYQEKGETSKIAHLREIAEGLDSLMKNPILKMLDSFESK